MSKDKEKELKDLYNTVESRNRKIARVPTAHFPPFDSIKPGDSIDDQMRKVTDFQEEHDPVNHPSHYNQFGIECLDAIEASMTPVEFRGYLKGNCQKYIWRYVYKGKPVEDLKKAAFYLNKLIEKVEENGV
jgi:hypothetical protein